MMVISPYLGGTMTAKALAQVLLRVWGVILMISAAIWMVAAFALAPSTWKMTLIPVAMRLLIELGAGLTLIRNGDRIGAWLVSDIEEEGPPANALQIQTIGFAILGAWFLIHGIADLLSKSSGFINPPKLEEGSAPYYREKAIESLVIAGAQTLAGAILLFRRVDLATRVSRIWRSVRRKEDEAS
jgi:hypothetical protein